MKSLPTSLRIGVLRGGPSPEYNVSLQTGANVLKTLSETHRPIDIFISKDGKWHVQGLERSPERVLKNVDVVFNALHGAYGEDGGVQEILSSLGVPYTGSERYPSAISMNKWMTKENARKAGIKTPISFIVRQDDSLLNKSKEIWSSVPHPLIVKPVSGGSSHGIDIINSYPALLSILENNSEAGDSLVEEYISGKEATCGIIDQFRGQKIYTLPIVEIRAPQDRIFFDTESKYNGQASEIVPGNFTLEEKREIEKVSKMIHERLGLRHYSRSDFIVSPKRGVYFLEVNSLPGLTHESLLPKSLEAVGMKFSDFIHHVIHMAIYKTGLWL